MTVGIDEQVLRLLVRERVVGIVRSHSASAAQLTAAGAFLGDGGVHLVEFPLTSPAAMEAISLCRELGGGVVVGAGTVTTLRQVDAVADAGASFIVTPALDLQVLRRARDRGMATFPGALTPTEIASAMDAGATAVKVFPAGPLGPDYIEALLAPYPSLRSVPTGGISIDDVPGFLASGATAVGLGSDLVGDGSRTQIAARTARLRRHLGE